MVPKSVIDVFSTLFNLKKQTTSHLVSQTFLSFSILYLHLCLCYPPGHFLQAGSFSHNRSMMQIISLNKQQSCVFPSPTL